MVRCAQLLTVMTVLIVLSATASAASLTVGPGEMYTTIQEAVDAADPGDTIIVMPGEYTEDVVITKENITLRSSPVQGAALNGTITVEEQGVVIDGFEIFPQDESGVRGTESGISVTVTNSVIFGTGVGAKELVDEAEVKTDGQMTVIGDTPIGISIEANDALTASIDSDLDVDGWFSSGIQIFAGEDANISLTGDTVVSGDILARGIYVSSDDQLQMTVDGNVDVTANDAIGILIDAGKESNLAVNGDVTVTADVTAPAQWDQLTGLYITGDELSAVVSGDVSVNHAKYGTGILFTVGSQSDLSVSGNVSIAANSNEKYADITGVLVQGDDHIQTSLSGDITVLGGSWTYGVDWRVEDNSGISITGDVLIDTSFEDSEATGVYIVGQDQIEAIVEGDISVTADRMADGIVITVEEKLTASIDSDINVVARDVGLWAGGIEIAAGAGSQIDIQGTVSVSSFGKYTDAYGMYFLHSDCIFYEECPFDDGQGIDITILADVQAVADEASAYGIGLQLDSDSSLHTSLNFDGNLAAIGADEAFGVFAEVEDQSTINIKGDLLVQGGTATGIAADFSGDGHFKLSGTLYVESQDTDTWDSTHGVIIDADGNLISSIDAQLTVEGHTRGDATGIELVAGDASTTKVAGHVVVAAHGEDSYATGVAISADPSDEESQGQITAEIMATVQATSDRGSATGVTFVGGNDSSLFVSGSVSAASNSQDSSATGIGIQGVPSEVDIAADVTASSLNQANGIFMLTLLESSLNVSGDVTVTTTEEHGIATGVTLLSLPLGELGAADAGSKAVDVSIHGDVAVTAANGGIAASGVLLLTPFQRAEVDVTGDVTVAADRVAVGAAVFGDHVSFTLDGDVTATVGGEGGGSFVTGVSVVAADEASLNLNGMTDITFGMGNVNEEEDHQAYGVLVYAPTIFIEHSGHTQVHSARKAVGISSFDIASLLPFDVPFDAPFNVASNEGARERFELKNSGVIQVIGEEAVGVRFGVVDAAVLLNEGHISASGETAVAIDGNTSTGSIHLENRGTIVGDVRFGSGDDKATLHYGGLVDGLIDGGTGHDTLALLGQSVGQLPTEAKVSTVRVANFERGDVLGGFWSLGPGTQLAELGLEDGILYIDGNVLIDQVAVTGGKLGGHGKLIGNVVNSGGVVAPGSSFGILTVEGDYTQGADGVLEIEIGPGSGDALTAGEHYDQLLVLGGTATFADGTTIRVLPAKGVYKGTTEYLIVDGDNFVFNLAKLNIDFDGGLFLRGHLSEGSIKLIVENAPYESVATTPNQQAVAGALTEAKGKPDTDLDDLYSLLDSLEKGQENDALALFEGLTGEVYTQVPTLAARRIDHFAGTVHAALETVPTFENTMWANAFSDKGQIAATSGTAGVELRATGIAFGGGVFNSPSSQIGLVAAFDSGSLEMADRASLIQSNGNQVGAYVRTTLGGIKLTGLASYGKSLLQSERIVGSGSAATTALANLGMTDLNLSLEARLQSFPLGRVYVQPLASLGWFTVTREAIEEEGAGNIGLSSPKQSTSGLGSRIGLQTYLPMTEEVGAYAGVSWVSDLVTPERQITATLQGAPGSPFTIKGSEPAKSGIEVKLGIAAPFTSDATFRFDFIGEYRGETAHQTLQGEFSLTF